MNKIIAAISMFMIVFPVFSTAQGLWESNLNYDKVSAISVCGDYVWAVSRGTALKCNRQDFSVEYIPIFTEEPAYDRCFDMLLEHDAQGNLWAKTPFFHYLYDGESWQYASAVEQYRHVLDAKTINAFSDGSTWFGMYEGALRYDGENWTKYTGEQLVSELNDIVVDSSGAMWICSQSGVWKYADGDMVLFTVEDGLASNSVSSVAIDRDGVLWFGTRNGLTRFDGSEWRSYKTRDGLIHNRISDIAVDDNNNLWITALNGVSRFDGENWSSYTEENELISNTVSEIVVDPDNNIWLCHPEAKHGIEYFDGTEWVWLTIWDPDAELPSNDVRDVAFGPGNIRWFATNEGLVRNEGGLWEIITDKDGLADKQVNTVTVLADGSVWVTYEAENRNILSRFQDGVWTTFSKDNGLVTYEIRSLVQTGDDIWLASKSGLYRKEDDGWAQYPEYNSLISSNIMDVAEGPDGTIWFATEKGLTSFINGRWKTLTKADGLSSDYIRSVDISPDGTVWFQTLNGEIVSYDGDEMIVFKPPVDEINNQVLQNADLIKVDMDGVVWTDVQAEDGSLYYIRNNQWHYCSVPLFDVTDIDVDSDNVKWFSTNLSRPISENSLYGIVRYDGSEWKSIHSDMPPVDIDFGYEVIFAIDHSNRLMFKVPSESPYWVYEGSEFSAAEIAVDSKIESIYHDDFGRTWYVTGPELIAYRDERVTERVDIFEDGLDGKAPLYQSLSVNPDGSLCIGTSRGLYLYNGEEITASYFTPESPGQDVRSISQAMFDKNGILWMTIFDERGGYSLWRYDGEDWSEVMGAVTTLKLCKDRDSELWIGTDSLIFKVKNGKLSQLLANEGTPFSSIYDMTFDRNNVLLISNNFELYAYDGETLSEVEKPREMIATPFYSIVVDENNVKWFVTFSGIISYDDREFVIHNTEPEYVSLRGNFPNPFNSATSIEFDLDISAPVELTVYDILGRKVRTIETGPMPVGRNRMAWDGRNGDGDGVSSGMYLYRVKAGGKSAVGRMMFVK